MEDDVAQPSWQHTSPSQSEMAGKMFKSMNYCLKSSALQLLSSVITHPAPCSAAVLGARSHPVLLNFTSCSAVLIKAPCTVLPADDADVRAQFTTLIEVWRPAFI